MPDKYTPLFENGLIAAIGFVFTAILSAVGLHVKSDIKFKQDVHKRINKVELTMRDKHDHILENYPDKDDFNRLEKSMISGLQDIKAQLVNNK